MEYIVTGGAGYIGGHLVDELVGLGVVNVIDDFSSGSYINKKATYLKSDLAKETPKIPSGCLIYHLAADHDVKESMNQIKEHFERDVKATLNVAEMARMHDADGIIFASSSTVYGEAEKMPTPESAALKPISYYGLYKLLGEQILEFYSRNYAINVTVLRLANVIGGRMSHGVIVDFIKKLRNNSRKLEILGNGHQKKSYVHINDLIELFLALKPMGFKVYNVGNKDWVNVLRIAEIVEEAMGVHPDHVFMDFKEGRGWEGDVRFMLLDISLIENELGWKPSLSSEEAVKRAVNELINK